MSDIIQLLPDAVANQIAAGEVIQRPASVVKELMENAVDAEADSITLNIKDAGRTLLEIIDNGKGMSETDARMAFERHATSKIQQAPDLFTIRTMGFRGEALASVSAIADVELKTRLKGEELGTYIQIKGSEVLKQTTVSCLEGSIFTVRDLFYNVPARRKFLKSNSTEYGHILTEFRKVALAYPEKSFKLINEGETIYDLRAGSLADRIAGFFGKNIKSSLVPASSETEMLKIQGYIGKPDIAKKRKGEQYFYVNNRFMKHPYFFKSVMLAYENILKPDYYPVFFLYFDIDPEHIDVNIHPAKTEINFDDAKGIFSVLRATLKEALGRYNVVPSIDFDREGDPDIPLFKFKGTPKPPREEYDRNYNPFNETTPKRHRSSDSETHFFDSQMDDFERNDYIEQFEKEKPSDALFSDKPEMRRERYLQIGNKYILTAAKSGLMLISQKRAYERILFEQFMDKADSQDIASQTLMYPVKIELGTEDFEAFSQIDNELNGLGFEIEMNDDLSITIRALPAHFDRLDEKFLVEQILNLLKDDPESIKEEFTENIAQITARNAAHNFSNKRLAKEEIQSLTQKLFACRMPNFSPSGSPVIKIMTTEEIQDYLQK